MGEWQHTYIGIHVVVPGHEATAVDEDHNRPARASRLVRLYWLVDIDTVPCVWPVLYGGLGLDLAVVLAAELGLDGPVELGQRRRHFGIPGVAVSGQGFPNGLHVRG